MLRADARRAEGYGEALTTQKGKTGENHPRARWERLHHADHQGILLERPEVDW